MKIRYRCARWLRVPLCLGLVASGMAAQAPITDGSTIRVYANLMQIPVLILSQRHQPLPPIDAAKFTVRLGTTQPFRPGIVRQEGEDPITLAILLDGASPDGLVPLLLDGLPSMADRQLTGRDRIAVYGTMAASCAVFPRWSRPAARL